MIERIVLILEDALKAVSPQVESPGANPILRLPEGAEGFGLDGGGGLVVGAEPADEAALFLGGAFVVEGDEAGEERLLERLGIRMGGVEAVGEGDGGDEVGPAVGFEDGGVEVVVDLREEGDEALVVDGFGLGVERGAGAEEVEDVVEAGEGERGVQGLLLPESVSSLVWGISSSTNSGPPFGHLW